MKLQNIAEHRVTEQEQENIGSGLSVTQEGK